jgi:hypothetical protein
VHAVRRDRRLPGRGQYPLVEHRFGPARALLARLEHEDDVTVELVARGAEQPRGAHQHRHVQVVPAGVHGSADLGGVLQAGELRDRQRVHVGAQQHGGRSRPAATDDRGDRAERRARRDLQRQARQRREQRLLGTRQVQADLG